MTIMPRANRRIQVARNVGALSQRKIMGSVRQPTGGKHVGGMEPETVEVSASA